MQTDRYSRLCGRVNMQTDPYSRLCGRVDMQTDPYSRLCGHCVEGLTSKLTLTADCVIVWKG